nr:hypothetical protein [Tanacetum cinerariifolium]
MVTFVKKKNEKQHPSPCVDKNALDKEVANTIKDHKRKHDDDEDNDDEDPPAGPNLGKKTKRITKESKSSKKPSTTKKTWKVSKQGSRSAGIHLVVRWLILLRNRTTRTFGSRTELELFQFILIDFMACFGDLLNRTLTLKITCSCLNDVDEDLKDLAMCDFSYDALCTHWLSLKGVTLLCLVSRFIGHAYNLLKGACSSSIELEYHFQECFNALTDKLDWNNPKGDLYPFDLSKPLPLQGHPARYEIERIKGMVPTLWSPTKVRVKSVSVKKLHGYGHLEEIVVKRADRQLYKFKEGDFVDLHLNDIECMLLLAVQHKQFHLIDSDIVDFIVSLRMFTRSLVIKKRVEDLQLWCRELPKET